jgi:N-acetylmuramoyl-L-alanine amidase
MNLPYVFLDAGHGINTAGNRSPRFGDKKDYMLEYEFNISLCIMLYKLLKDNKIDVQFSSNDLTDLPLKERISYIEKTNKANIVKYDSIMISIHTNAHGDGKTFNEADGIEILYNPNNAKDLKLSNTIHKEFLVIPNLKSRGLKYRSNLALLNSLTIPATLIECGFMTNKKDLEKLLSYEYKLNLAHAIVNGIKNYYEI